MDMFFALVWFGGLIAAFEIPRKGTGRVMHFFAAVFWPMGIGALIVRKYLHTHKD